MMLKPIPLEQLSELKGKHEAGKDKSNRNRNKSRHLKEGSTDPTLKTFFTKVHKPLVGPAFKPERIEAFEKQFKSRGVKLKSKNSVARVWEMQEYLKKICDREDLYYWIPDQHEGSNLISLFRVYSDDFPYTNPDIKPIYTLPHSNKRDFMIGVIGLLLQKVVPPVTYTESMNMASEYIESTLWETLEGLEKHDEYYSEYNYKVCRREKRVAQAYAHRGTIDDLFSKIRDAAVYSDVIGFKNNLTKEELEDPIVKWCVRGLKIFESHIPYEKHYMNYPDGHYLSFEDFSSFLWDWESEMIDHFYEQINMTANEIGVEELYNSCDFGTKRFPKDIGGYFTELISFLQEGQELLNKEKKDNE